VAMADTSAAVCSGSMTGELRPRRTS
jgi:hypothetical protein